MANLLLTNVKKARESRWFWKIMPCNHQWYGLVIFAFSD